MTYLRLIPIASAIGISIFFAHAIYNHNPEFYETIPMHSAPNSSSIEIDARIQNQNYKLEIDTGSRFNFSLLPNSLKSLEKKDLGKIVFFDVHGNSYQVNSFELDQIKLGRMSYNNIKVKEESIDFISKFAYAEPKDEPDPLIIKQINMNRGRIGNGAIRQLAGCWFRFSYNEFIMIHNVDQFQNLLAYPFSGYAVADIEYWKNLIIISVDTDQGLKKFMLDTGCSNTMLNQKDENTPLHSTIKTKIFKIGNINFGPQKLYQFNQIKEASEDGIIGMDFLKNRSIFIDFENNKLYIGPEENAWSIKIF